MANEFNTEVEQEEEINEEEEEINEEEVVVEEEEVEEEVEEEEVEDKDTRIKELEDKLANSKKEKRQTKRALNKVTKTGPQELSTLDIYALVEAKVPQADIEEVIKASKILGKTIPEALQDTTVQMILKSKAESRSADKASNIKTSRPSSKQVSDDEILAQANKGEFPKKGSDEAERLFWLRRGRK